MAMSSFTKFLGPPQIPAQNFEALTVNLALEGHLLVGKFTWDGGNSRRAGGDFPHQFIS